MVSRLAVIALTSCLTSLPALAAPCVGPEALPGVSAGPRSAADPARSTTSTSAKPAVTTGGRTVRSSQDCDASLSGDSRQAASAVTRKGNALKIGDTEIRINGRVRAEGAYGR
ncbi:conserved exported hypothetical protein [Hyphomicrobiales bacterium]|nr:conserved exported hypothetical protein [Hyphomicrobiales bacterium]